MMNSLRRARILKLAFVQDMAEDEEDAQPRRALGQAPMPLVAGQMPKMPRAPKLKPFAAKMPRNMITQAPMPVPTPMTQEQEAENAEQY